MGQTVSSTDYQWVYTDEPHATRRKEILAKHPEIKTLMGSDPVTKYISVALVAFQIFSCYMISVIDPRWPLLILAAYVLGGTINNMCQMVMHEFSHNNGFGHGKPLSNFYFGMFCNLPIGVPAIALFKIHHRDHHKYQGDEVLDIDIPCKFETILFQRPWSKVLWLILQPFFYTLRPMIMLPHFPTPAEIINIVTQLTFDVLILYLFGIKALMYLITGTILAMGLHPVAGHFVAEHYIFTKGQETYSYYGPLNWICYNVGYHTEHHDFPNISGRRLPKVKEMAPEFYENLPCHHSWIKVLKDFVFDTNLGPAFRVKRKSRINKNLY